MKELLRRNMRGRGKHSHYLYLAQNNDKHKKIVQDCQDPGSTLNNELQQAFYQFIAALKFLRKFN